MANRRGNPITEALYQETQRAQVYGGGEEEGSKEEEPTRMETELSIFDKMEGREKLKAADC